jgi:membrane-associated phospholipid phosphatase
VLLGAGIVTIAVARRRVHLALVAGVVVAGACATTEVLKHFILGRPDLVNPNPLGPSFPSGHTTVAMSLAVALVLVVPPNRRALVALLGLAYACAVGAGVLTAGWHRPSDVMGAFLVVTAWAAAGTAALVMWRGAPPEAEPMDSDDVVDPLAIGGAALLVVGFVGFVIVYLALRQDRLDAVRLSGAYAAALIAIVGTGLIAMATILATIGGVELDPLNRAAGRPGTTRQAR